MTQISVIAETGDLCGECPVWSPEQGVLEWTDCTGQKLYRLDWATRKYNIITRQVLVNGFRRNRRGGFVITNGQGVSLWDGVDDFTSVVTECGGRPCPANDCVADSRGRLLTGTVFYNPAVEYELGDLLSVEADGRARILDQGFHMANGLGFSPDETRLYFADSAARRIYSYDYAIATGRVSNRKVLVQVPREEGVPDGLAVNAQGFIWSAQWYGSCVVRYDPDGKVERRIETPAKQTSSLAFGGPELTDIFVTTAAQSEAMPIMPPGYDPIVGNFGGSLYRLNLEIPGQIQYPASIKLPTTARSKE